MKDSGGCQKETHQVEQLLESGSRVLPGSCLILFSCLTVFPWRSAQRISQMLLDQFASAFHGCPFKLELIQTCPTQLQTWPRCRQGCWALSPPPRSVRRVTQGVTMTDGRMVFFKPVCWSTNTGAFKCTLRRARTPVGGHSVPWWEHSTSRSIQRLPFGLWGRKNKLDPLRLSWTPWWKVWAFQLFCSEGFKQNNELRATTQQMERKILLYPLWPLQAPEHAGAP